MKITCTTKPCHDMWSSKINSSAHTDWVCNTFPFAQHHGLGVTIRVLSTLLSQPNLLNVWGCLDQLRLPSAFNSWCVNVLPYTRPEIITILKYIETAMSKAYLKKNKIQLFRFFLGPLKVKNQNFTRFLAVEPDLVQIYRCTVFQGH